MWKYQLESNKKVSTAHNSGLANVSGLQKNQPKCKTNSTKLIFQSLKKNIRNHYKTHKNHKKFITTPIKPIRTPTRLIPN
jgi:hypothetical protein